MCMLWRTQFIPELPQLQIDGILSFISLQVVDTVTHVAGNVKAPFKFRNVCQKDKTIANKSSVNSLRPGARVFCSFWSKWSSKKAKILVMPNRRNISPFFSLFCVNAPSIRKFLVVNRRVPWAPLSWNWFRKGYFVPRLYGTNSSFRTHFGR